MYQTERLLLRPWRDDDAAPFAEMNADPEVMRYFLQPLTPEESRNYLEAFRERMAQNGFGFWAVEERHSGELAGFVGLSCRFPPALRSAGGFVERSGEKVMPQKPREKRCAWVLKSTASKALSLLPRYRTCHHSG